MLTVEHSRQERVLLAMLEDCWQEPGVREDHKGIVLDWCLEQGREDWHQALNWARLTRRWPVDEFGGGARWFTFHVSSEQSVNLLDSFTLGVPDWSHWIPSPFWWGENPTVAQSCRFPSEAEAWLGLAQQVGGWLAHFADLRDLTLRRFNCLGVA